MAQLVARGVWDAEVAGSSPVAPTRALKSRTTVLVGFLKV